MVETHSINWGRMFYLFRVRKLLIREKKKNRNKCLKNESNDFCFSFFSNLFHSNGEKVK